MFPQKTLVDVVAGLGPVVNHAAAAGALQRPVRRCALAHGTLLFGGPLVQFAAEILLGPVGILARNRTVPNPVVGHLLTLVFQEKEVVVPRGVHAARQIGEIDVPRAVHLAHEVDDVLEIDVDRRIGEFTVAAQPFDGARELAHGVAVAVGTQGFGRHAAVLVDGDHVPVGRDLVTGGRAVAVHPGRILDDRLIEVTIEHLPGAGREVRFGDIGDQAVFTPAPREGRRARTEHQQQTNQFFHGVHFRLAYSRKAGYR